MIRKILLSIVASAFLAAPVITVSAAQSGEKAGEYVDDAAITAKVKTALAKEKNLKSLPISVETTGGVVTLSGEVISSVQKDKAEDVAKNVKGVKDVHNGLQLKGGGT